MRRLRSALVPLTLFCLTSLGGSACLERDLHPVVPCVSQGFVASIQQNAVDKVDLLFMVDNSPSMVEEQASLAAQIPTLITVLTTGHRSTGPDFPPVKDLHAGVVTSEMGVAGIPNVPTCMRAPDFGDDGILLTVPKVGGTGCMASYPSFLQFTAGTTDPAQYATDFTCLARTGAMGCGFEQQLDAMLKAVVPSGDPTTFAEGTHGHGDEANNGFLRTDSLVVLFAITDEDDCSTNVTDIWNPLSTTHTGDLNLRCINYDSELYPIDRFVNGFKNLRPMNNNLVIFATITGVPEDLVAVTATDPTINYDRLFADPRMMNHVTTMGGTSTLDPACSATGRGAAAPGIRMARVAQQFGENGVVQSICQSDYGPALDVIIQKIANALGNVCLPRKLNPDAMGNVGCDVVEVYDPAVQTDLAGGTGNECQNIPGAVQDSTGSFPAARIDADGKVHCKITQLPVDRSTGSPGVPGGTGWYYDDFSMDTLLHCGVMMMVGSGQRIAFSGTATPPQGTTVNLECLQRVQGAGGTGVGAQIGSACTATATPMTPQACYGGAGAPAMKCDDMALICQQVCATTADCPTALVCDVDNPLVATDGSSFTACVNPICI